ncbi:MAG: hypothetical protein R3194_11695, partial [Limnobacter sp.]|nr:hypothetical protein [Limnobacter sp.]
MNQANNQFEGLVTAVGTGTGSSFELTEQGNSEVQIDGVNRSIIKAQQGQAAVAMTNAGGVSIEAGSVVLGKVGSTSTLTGDLNINTQSSLSQQGALLVQGESHLSANQITLTDAQNHFVGQVDLEGLGASGAVSFSDSGDLTVRLDGFDNATISAQQRAEVLHREVGNVQAQGRQVVLGGAEAGSRIKGNLTALATDSIEQTAFLNVDGQTRLSANQINLMAENNQFEQGLFVTGQGASSQATIRSGGDIQALFDGLTSVNLEATSRKVEIGLTNSGSAFVNAREVLLGVAGAGVGLDGSLSVIAPSSIAQSEAVRVGGAATFESSQITLTNPNNDLMGTVNGGGSGASSVLNLHDVNDLNIQGSGFGRVQLTAGGALASSLDNVGRVQLQADSIVLGQSSITGDLQVLASTFLGQSGHLELAGMADFNLGSGVIELNQPDNEFASGLTIRAGSVNLSNRSDLLVDFLEARQASLLT